MEWNPEIDLPDEFFSVIEKIYDKDPYFLSENQQLIKYLFSRSHDFFAGGKAWVHQDSKMRLCGFFKSGMAVNGKRAAYFGFWETFDSQKENVQAFKELELWAQAQGAEVLVGPINFSTYHQNRIRIGSFKKRPLIGEPYNPEYYSRILLGSGFSELHRYMTAEIEPWTIIKYPWHWFFKNKFLPKDCESLALTPDLYKKHLEEIFIISDVIFSQNLGYQRINLEQFNILYGSYGKYLCPYTSRLVLKSGKVVAFSFNLPDYGPLLFEQKIPLQEISFETHFNLLKKPKLLFKTYGVSPEMRRQGIHFALIGESTRHMKKYYSGVTACLMRSGSDVYTHINLPYRKREFALYEKDLLKK